VRATIHKVNASIVIGKMTAGAGWTTYSGQAFDRWFTALGATKARPGGGFYNDERPLDMLDKALECGRQRATLPPSVRDVQYELENFPYQRLKKSPATVVNECSLALAHGLNGVAFNMLGMPASTFEDNLPWVKAIPAARPVWEKWVAHAAGLPTTGLWPAWSARMMARRSVRPGESWLGWAPKHNINIPKVLGDIGLPLASDTPACATVLCGYVADVFSDDELKTMLARGVLMDSTALGLLTERGLGRLAGVRLAKRLDNGMWERFSDDPMNGRAAGEIRDARIEFWGDAKGMADVLEPISQGVRVLTTIEDYFARPQGAGMTAFENELGGRVVVMGYAPWIFLHSVGKRLQLQNAADWISRDTMPVRVDETVPLLSVARVAADRQRGAVMLLNAGFDPIPEATVHLRMTGSQARLLSIGRRAQVLPVEPEATGVRITVKDVEPWGVRCVLI
jgi:hypothetical protein